MFLFGLVMTIIGISVIEKGPNTSLSNFWLQVTETAVGEEIIYRCITLGIFLSQNLGERKSNFFQVILFSLVHIPRYIVSGTWGGFILASIFGLFSGTIILKTRNGLGSIVAHGLMNSLLYFVA